MATEKTRQMFAGEKQKLYKKENVYHRALH